MRIRSIKPEFFKHDILCEMTPLSRILFIGLWCMADCAGRLEDRPRRIKAEVLPYDEADVDQMLNELKEHGFVERYESEGQQVIEIPSFLSNQRITGKEAESVSRFPSISRKRSVKHRGNNRETPGFTGREGKGRETESNGDGNFDLFWAAYPKKKAKDKARSAFEKADAPISVIVTAVQRAAGTEEWRKQNGQFIPHAATWLNGRRWEDELSLIDAGHRPLAFGEIRDDPSVI